MTDVYKEMLFKKQLELEEKQRQEDIALLIDAIIACQYNISLEQCLELVKIGVMRECPPNENGGTIRYEFIKSSLQSLSEQTLCNLYRIVKL